MSEEAELERRLDAVRLSLQAELSEPLTADPEHGLAGDPDLSADWRTDTLVNRGRPGTGRRGLPGLPGLPPVSPCLKTGIIQLAVLVVAVLLVRKFTGVG